MNISSWLNGFPAKNFLQLKIQLPLKQTAAVSGILINTTFATIVTSESTSARSALYAEKLMQESPDVVSYSRIGQI